MNSQAHGHCRCCSSCTAACFHTCVFGATWNGLLLSGQAAERIGGVAMQQVTRIIWPAGESEGSKPASNQASSQHVTQRNGFRTTATCLCATAAARTSHAPASLSRRGQQPTQGTAALAAGRKTRGRLAQSRSEGSRAPAPSPACCAARLATPSASKHSLLGGAGGAGVLACCWRGGVLAGWRAG